MSRHMYRIIAKYKDSPEEVIDTAKSLKEAMGLLVKYRITYGGNGWRIWFKGGKS